MFVSTQEKGSKRTKRTKEQREIMPFLREQRIVFGAKMKGIFEEDSNTQTPHIF